MNDNIKFLLDFCDFKMGNMYILLAIARRKNNPMLKKDIIIKEKVNNRENLIKKYHKLKTIARSELYEYNIYITINARDYYKAWFALQNRINNYIKDSIYSDENKEQMLKSLGSINNVWFSELMKPHSRATRYFIIDIDTKDMDVLTKILKDMRNLKVFIHYTPTTHGYHVITKPFDFTKFNFGEKVELKKDGLMFIERV